MDETCTLNFVEGTDTMLSDDLNSDDLIFENDVFKNLFEMGLQDDFTQLVSSVTLEFEVEAHDFGKQETENVLNDNFFEVPNWQESLFSEEKLIDFPTISQKNHYNNIQDLKLFDDTLNELSEFIQLAPVEEKIVVAMPKKSVNDLYHLTRNRLTPISVYYNISNNDRYLKIELISGSSAAEETIKFCKLSQKSSVNKHPDYWFLCNDKNVELGDSLKISLDPKRNERCLSIKFACNTSCESMFHRTILKFSIIDNENCEICQQSFNIRVSERPGRDERDLVAKQGKEEVKKFSYPEDLPSFLDERQIIKNEVPKLKNYTAPNCKFEISLASDNKKFLNNKFSESIEKPIKFNITKAIVENSSSKLYVRTMIVDPKHPEKRIVCAKRHGTTGEFKNHILRCFHDDAIYQGTETGFYADERYSVKVPCQSNLSYQFMCNNLCWIDRDRYFAGLIVILENEEGEMFARRYFKFAIVDRPNRTNLSYDSDCDVAATKRKSTGESSPRKRRSINT